LGAPCPPPLCRSRPTCPVPDGRAGSLSRFGSQEAPAVRRTGFSPPVLRNRLGSDPRLRVLQSGSTWGLHPRSWAPDADLVPDEEGGPQAGGVQARLVGGTLSPGDGIGDRVLYRRIQCRDGPQHDDFSPPEDDHLEPSGRARFLGPVALLTNRRTFSAAESFVLAMRATPNVTVIGDITGGGSGNPIQREMPNGWTFTISRWIERAPDGTTHEGVGLEPDLPALIPEGQLGTADHILQAAIQHLRGEIR
jgi:hypothetical protein